MDSPRPKVCILATHHAYQYKAHRRAYLENVKCLVEIHSVDFVGEEAADSIDTYAQEIAKGLSVPWRNIDLTSEERRHVPDINRRGIGTLVDPDLQMLREWVWVIRTAKAMKRSALVICGLAHMTGLAAKFLSVGFDIETNVYFDRTDDENIANRIEGA